jgi:hypothetical protein
LAALQGLIGQTLSSYVGKGRPRAALGFDDLSITKGFLGSSARVAVPVRGTHAGTSPDRLKANTIRLDAGSTKNDEGRVVYLPERLTAEIAAQIERVRKLELKLGRVIPYLFPHFTNGRRYCQGARLEDFKQA